MRLLWHRRFQPAALALVIVCAVQGISLVPGPVQSALEGPVAWAAGVAALVAAVLLAAAWWSDRPRLLVAALDVATVVWAWIALVAMSGRLWVSAATAVGWVVLAAGSAWAERADPG